MSELCALPPPFKSLLDKPRLTHTVDLNILKDFVHMSSLMISVALNGVTFLFVN